MVVNKKFAADAMLALVLDFLHRTLRYGQLHPVSINAKYIDIYCSTVKPTNGSISETLEFHQRFLLPSGPHQRFQLWNVSTKLPKNLSCALLVMPCHFLRLMARKELVMVYAKQTSLHFMHSLTAMWICFFFWGVCIYIYTCNCNCDRPLREVSEFLQSCLNKASKRAPRTRAQSNSPALEKAHDPPMACLSWVSKAPWILELLALWHVKSSEKRFVCDTDTIWYGMIWHYATSLDI